ncbi:zinc knuckle, partial [Ostertagia ostertagi]
MVATGYDIRKKHDPMWIDTILAKFPYDIIKDCMKASSTDSKLTVGRLLEELHEHVSSKALFENRYASLTSRRINAETAQRAKTAKQESCLFCQRNNHQTKDCTVRTPIDRRNALRGQPVCWKCFASDHRSRACFQRNCPRCNGDHHISLCSYNAGETSSVTSSVTSARTKSQDETRKTSSGSDRKTTTQKGTYRNQTSHMTVDKVQAAAPTKEEQKAVNSFSNQTHGNSHEKNLVLMTVEGQIKNNANGSFENVLIFLDSGAQCNLIAASLADALALPRGDPYQCTMHGIGGTAQTYTAQQVTAVFRTRFGETLAINLSTKPVLTNAFPAATLTDSDVQFLKQN